MSNDFQRVAAAALARADSLVPEWLPSGRREGDEWSALNPNRADQKLGSFKINLTTGAWGDFAAGDSGGDLLSLYCYIRGLSNVDGLKALASSLGVVLAPFNPNEHSSALGSALAQAVHGGVDSSIPTKKKPRSDWVPMPTVPAGVIDAPRSHFKHGAWSKRWTYINQAGDVLGYICRFDSADGSKEILPCVFAKHAQTGEMKWNWMQFTEPRPLYMTRPLRDGKKVVIVEGEKCVDALATLLADRADVVSWPGGSKATAKADWAWLTGKQVVIWPDCDSQREKLSKDELAAGVDPAIKPYLSIDKQPGMVAAELIAATLVKLGCEVRIVVIPEPGIKPSGWDVADVIAEGATCDAVLALLADTRAPSALAPKKESTPRAASAMPFWSDLLISRGRGGWEDCYQNVYLVLTHHPEWKGVIAYDEFAQAVIKVKPTPCGTLAGEWKAYDDQRLGLWLAQNMDIVIKGDGPIAAGVSMTAHENRIHPIRDYLDTLVWDGVARLDKWIKKCMGGAAAVTSDTYLSIAGTKFLIGAVARIYEPGCKMDNMLIFEGGQGKGKSTAIRVLGGQWFSDSHLDLQSKDCYMALNGVWFYEVAEMDAFSRAEATRVKAFITSPEDNYREPYQRREVSRPRQTVFLGSTNQNEYLKDTTGNRRYWPVRVDGVIDLNLLREWRDQLFAEAVAMYRDGEKWHVNGKDEIEYFIPEQDFRCIEDPWMNIIANYVNSAEGSLKDEITVDFILMDVIKMPADRMSNTKGEAQRIAPIIKALGFERGRSGARNDEGKRPTVYIRKNPPPAQAGRGVDFSQPII